MIKETQAYTLQCGPSSQDEQSCYQIINKEFGVIEVETSILPQAMKYLMDLQAGLDMINDEAKDQGDLTNVTSISDRLN